MKTYAAFCAAILSAATFLRAAEISTDPDVLSPRSTIEVRFDKPMISKDQVGTTARTSPLVVTPPIEGEFSWTSTRGGNFRFTRLPDIGTEYAFSLREGLKDASGEKVDVEDFGTLQTEAFALADHERDYPYDSGNSAQRMARFLLQFNDAINPADVTKLCYFETSDKSQRVPAKARLASGKDFKKFYSRSSQLTWEERMTLDEAPIVKGDATRPNALIVEASELLPVGTMWHLILPATVTNQSGKAKLAEAQSLEWGTIKPLAVNGVRAQTHFDHPHAINVTFNKTLVGNEVKSADAAQRLLPFISVDPPVPNLQVDAGYSSLAISGDYVLGQSYHLTLKRGLPSADNLGLDNEVSENVVFHPSPAFISTSVSTNGQMASGKGIFDIYAANFKDLHVRVKQLATDELVAARDMVTEFNNIDKPTERAAEVKKKPFAQLPGKPIFEKSFSNAKPLEKATLFTLNWHEILGQTPTAPLIIELEADPQAGAPAGQVMTRAVLEFTDIGLVVKSSGKDSLVHVFSLKTGAPIADAKLTYLDGAHAVIREAKSDAQGLATVETGAHGWILAQSGSDCTAIEFGDNGNRIGMWGFGLNLAWESPWNAHEQTFLFSDRPIYKPGDTAHVKAISRTLTGDTFSIAAPRTAKLSLRDPRGREIMTKTATFTANGTWSDDIALPDGAVGWYDLSIDFAPDKKPDPNQRFADPESVAAIQLRVDDYKPNTFEVAIDGKKFESQADRVKVPLKARYYMGKALSSAKVMWNASLALTWTPPEAYAEYHFGDVPSWWHYGQDRDEDNAAEEEDENGVREWGAHGELTLKDDGTASIEMPPPPLHKAALPQTVTVYADVTDVNQQTISATTEFQLPGADYVVGVRKNRWFGTAGQPIDFEFAAITPKGAPFTSGTGVDVKIERQEWNTVRVEAAGNAASVKNQATLIEVQKAAVQLSSSNGKASGATLSFTPKDGGTYFLTATAKDASGKTILSRVPFYVISNNGFPWAWDEGSRIKLEPDKTVLTPGETASIVVKTPIAGNALVTVERSHVMRQFIAPISPENPVVKVPVTDEDAPNCFVSVMVIRGADQNPAADKMPVYKIGCCELTINSDAKKLFVKAESSQAEVLPGSDLTVSATITDAKKAPVAGAEVTLFAVDEGVLSLMEFKTPEPFPFFHAPRPLAVASFSSIDNLIHEALDNRVRGNKGTVVGGGGDEGSADEALRKNFVATALWSAALITDKDGRVTAAVKAPDSLTRYRIMAVAVKDADRFGHAESAFTVNKPLMIEPVVPRFAHLGDEILLKAVLHNTTPHAGQVEVELKLDDNATLISEQRPYALIGLKNRTMTNDGKSERRVVSLKAGETTALAFPVRFVKRGTCSWQWRVQTTEWPDKPLTDAVESKFDVTNAAPPLREVHYLQLTSASANDDMLKQISPQLLEGDGSVRLDFSQSRMFECRDAMEYLLHYPYGCVEQTTSSMLPWLALGKYEPMFPDLLQKDKVVGAIKSGVDRLLQMQTDEGGLSYWPGSNTPLLWASAYGGFALFKAKEWGIPIPQASLDKLTDWMAKDLRELDLNKTQDTFELSDAALALYTLAKAGKPEAAYQNTLYMRRDRLPEMSRMFLALSMCITNAPEKQITDLLAKPKSAKWERYWLGPDTASGLRLIVDAQLGLTKELNAGADELLKRRNGQGHWGTTFSNAWILLGMSTAERAAKDSPPVPLQLTSGVQNSDLNLPNALSSVATTLPFNHDKGAPPTRVSVPQGQTVRSRVEITSYPDLKTYKPVTKGFGLKRSYQRLTQTGILEPAENLRVGDLIVVTLEIDVQKPNRYLALEDPLPSVFEPINPEFSTQNKRADAKAEDNEWMCDHRELRNNKALFFTDGMTEKGQFQLRYLARVIAEGDVIAPPARIEAMYEPTSYGLSNIERLQTLPMTNGKDVADK